MDVEGVEPAKPSVLKLRGRWTIERALELKETLMRALEEAENVRIDVEELVEADLSCLQLLCAAHRRSLKLGKRLALHEKKSGDFARTVRDAGFVRSLGCEKDIHRSCLWIGGWES